ncbi:MAG: thioredoxin-disulfide reductase [Candidatus Kerfeldbacteria bacterium]|nr:thioredoxin-disulfide reductase [Candidatus Kerfeldbacteria bacterium]
MDTHRKVIIIGSGPAGLTAAIYTARAQLDPLVIAGIQAGGQLMLTSEVGNYPGFPKDILGPDLMQLMREQAVRFGTMILDTDVTAVDFTKRPLKVIVNGGDVYTAETVIVATGATAKWLELPSEQRLRGKGVSSCATCDAFFFKGKDVAVVGGGDTAMEDAIFLTKFANHVTVLVRGRELRASKIMADRARANQKIALRFSATVTEVLGESSVNGVRIKDSIPGADREETLPVQGLFVAIGHTPNTEIFRGQLELEPKAGYLVVKDQTRTSVDGVFACGDVQDFRYRQAVTAAGSGCMAALDAEAYLHRLSGT